MSIKGCKAKSRILEEGKIAGQKKGTDLGIYKYSRAGSSDSHSIISSTVIVTVITVIVTVITVIVTVIVM